MGNDWDWRMETNPDELDRQIVKLQLQIVKQQKKSIFWFRTATALALLSLTISFIRMFT